MNVKHPATLQPRKTPRQARSEVTVAAIFEATIQVLLSEGEQGMTTTRVAERAGVSVGTLYQYFPHKQALLYAIVQQYLQEYVEEFEAACLKHQKRSIAVIAKGIVKSVVDFKIRRPDMTRALYKIAEELDTHELRIVTTQRLQKACTNLLSTATDGKFANLHDVSFTLLTAMKGTTRAVFELGIHPKLIKSLRVQLLTMCHGYLQAAAKPILLK